MNYSEEQINSGDEVMPKVVPAPTPPPQYSKEESSFFDELLCASVKSLFLTFIAATLIVCILALSFPLSTMRIFNNMGLYERSVDFAERYITRRMKSEHVLDTDEVGNYTKLPSCRELSDGDFTEALYVCNSLCEKLLTESILGGNAARTKYYAERLEKYTRVYLSRYNLNDIAAATDRANIESMPNAALRPSVYSYKQRMRALNFRARTYLGTTDYVLYDNRSPDTNDILTSIYNRSMYFPGLLPSDDMAKAAALDDFTDYIGQLSEYLNVQFLLAGAETDVTAKRDVFDKASNSQKTDIPVNSELFIKNEYVNLLDGDEFNLIVKPKTEVTAADNGYTAIFQNLTLCFPKYAQWAVDITPSGDDGALHQLYWLQNLSLFARRVMYMETLLYYSRDNFGLNSEAIRDSYTSHTYEQFTRSVEYNNTKPELSEVYSQKLKAYLAAQTK